MNVSSNPGTDKSVTGQIALPLPDAVTGEVPDSPRISMPLERFSDYIVYVDESGDHGLKKVDQSYPVFVLAFCVFHKKHYVKNVVASVENFKFRHFGHDSVVLHEHEIRKEHGPFRFTGRAHKNIFLEELTDIVKASNFIIISCVIDKRKLVDRNSLENPYHVALGYCLETLYELMLEKDQAEYPTHVVVECRGKREDRDLELEFRRICDGGNRRGDRLPFRIELVDKRSNSPGLQLADLVARPIGLSVLRPGQENRAFQVLKQKFFCKGGRKKVGEEFNGWGLKVYP